MIGSNPWALCVDACQLIRESSNQADYSSQLVTERQSIVKIHHRANDQPTTFHGTEDAVT